ncbi:glycosyltransferase family 2 protein [Streptomyces sp. NRRL B-1347]|uniref:glycosyltransferase family 2 protein n=1 Tax=Streptomyces sp. NRRL B-1347 TaxID=1476877 RepID=UPI00068F096E|nr:glycosyltransferase [Streptomyces sp. NRRL B-1347]
MASNERPAAAGPVEGVTVVTLTRYRPVLVQRAMRSVRAQVTDVPVRHLVLIDDSQETLTALREVTDAFPHCEVRYVPREPHEKSGPGRSSRLRNLGVRLSGSAWIAFLDDDNEWTPDHLQSLLDQARAHSVRAVYSEVGLLDKDGAPYLEPRWPWANSVAEAERTYADYVAKGICVPGSNVIKDRPGTYEVPVDTSAWLLARELLLDVPFEEEFTAADADGLVSEDDKLYYRLVQGREPMVCTGRATLRYYLGGYSNSRETVTPEERGAIAWASE